MQRLEVSGAVRLIYRSLGVKGLMRFVRFSQQPLIISLKSTKHLVSTLQAQRSHGGRMWLFKYNSNKLPA